MANDIHVYLNADELELVRGLAAKEDRSLTNMVRTLVRRAIGVRLDDAPVKPGRPKRREKHPEATGRPDQL